MLIKNVKIENTTKDYKGICYINNFKCFVEEAIEGDTLDIEIHKETGKFYFAKIKKIINPSPYRNTNIECEYYKKCGGCALQHIKLDYYYQLKLNYIKELLNIDNIDIFKVGFNKRRRINLKYSNGKYGFYQKNTTNIVSINKCLNLTPSINNIISKLNNIKLTNLDSLDIFEADNGIGINFIFNKDPNINEFKKLDILKNDVILINYTYKDRKSFVPIIKNNDLFLTLKNKQVLLPNNFFMQATKESQDFMINKVCEEIQNYKNVYATGDISATKQLAHTATMQADYVMNKILKKEAKLIENDLIPSVIYGTPEAASIGVNEQDIENSDEYKIYNLPISFLAKSWCDNQIDGFIKIITKDDLIKGAHIVSNEASSLISQIQIMMITNYKVLNIKDIVFAHPTYSEGIMEAILNG